jgi:hypothetical protein
MPRPSPNASGYMPLGKHRLRPGIFSTVLEQKMEHLDGRIEWHASFMPHLLPEDTSPGVYVHGVYRDRDVPRPNGRWRVRNGLVFGAVLEEQVSLVGGTVEWQRSFRPYLLPALSRAVPSPPGIRRQRIRNGLFGAIVEELSEAYDGSSTWIRPEVPVELP